MMGVDLDGVFYCCRRAIPSMVRRQKGSILTISSMWGLTGGSCEAAYSAAKAGVIGLILVFLFMILVYRLPGLASSLALLIYTEIVLVILNAFDVTLTLPGIAGIILSIGMAVDANVIIFARVREEMAKGKTVKSSLKAGFQKQCQLSLTVT